MALLLEQITSFLYTNVSPLNLFLLVVSIVIFIFSKHIIDFVDTADMEKKNLNGEDKKNIEKKEKFLRAVTYTMILTYFITFYSHISFLNDLVKVLFVVMIIYILDALIKRKIFLLYGNEVEVGGASYIKRGYKTQVFSLMTTIISYTIFIYMIFKIFGIDSILEGGGLLAGILALIGFTSPVWAHDVIATIMMLNNGEVEVGNVVRIKEKGILAWVKNINLSEVKLIDLTHWNVIIMRPSEFRNQNIENLSNGVAGKRTVILSTLDLQVSYDVSKNELEEMVYAAYDEMIKNHPISTKEGRYFPEENKRFLEVDEFGDSAVTYKFGYYISSPFYIIKAGRLLNEYLLKYQKETNIYFSTPKLITISGGVMTSN